MSWTQAKETRGSTKSGPDDKDTKSETVEVLSVAKLNNLLDNVNNRLGGGLHGSFYEEGSRRDDKTRHEQLPVLFEVKQLLTDNLAMLEKQAQRSDAENEKSVKGPGKANGNLVSTIRNVIDQEISGKFRDLSIENDRLKKELKEKSEAHETKVKTLETKIKKLEGQSQAEKVSDAKIKSIEGRLKQVEENKSLGADVERIHEQVGKNAKIYNQGQNRIRSRLDALEKSKEEHDDWLGELEEWQDTHNDFHDTTLTDWCFDHFLQKPAARRRR